MIFGLVGWQATIIIVALIGAGVASIGIIAWAVKAIFTKDRTPTQVEVHPYSDSRDSNRR